MLNIPTLWMVFVVNFLALGLIWAYVARSYPKFDAARFWASSSFLAAAGAALATLHFYFSETLLPLLAGGTVLIFAAWLATMGIRRFHNEPVRWRDAVLCTGLSFALLAFFIFGYESTALRIFVYSVAEMVPFALSLKLLLSSRNGGNSPGARLAGTVAIVIISLYVLRAIGYVAHLGGDFSTIRPNPLQSVLMLGLMFLSMSWNFGFLLMAIDRLRNEVADLALLDDLTGGRQPPASAATAGRGMRQVRAQRRSFRAAGDRSRRLQGHQRHFWPCRGRCLPAAFHADGADPVAAGRHAGANRRRRVLCGAAGLDLARRRDDRPPHRRHLPRGRQAMRRRRYPDLGFRSGLRNGPARWAHSPTG